MTATMEPTRDAHPGVSRRSRSASGWWYLAPLLVALGVWIYGPAVFTAVLSFLDWNLTGEPGGFVGFDNYRRLIAEPEFAQAAGQTVLYALLLLPFSTIIPMGLAVLIWMRPGRASVIYRTLLFLPAMIAPVAVAVAWRFLLNPLQGLASEIAGWFGLDPINWLGDPRTALIAVVVVTAARVTAFNMLLFSAALSALDRRTIEAARLERATSWEVTRFVVVPQLAGTTVLLALLSVVLAGQWAFTNVAVLTQGGPDGTTDNVYYRIYTLGFGFFETGMASAAAVLVLLFFAVASAAWLMLRKRGRHDNS